MLKAKKKLQAQQKSLTVTSHIIGQHVSAMSVQPAETQEQNCHTCESFDPALHSGQAQQGKRNATREN